MAARISEDALDTLFRKARSYSSFADEPVSDAQLHAIYEIMKHGPTTANSQPQRIVFLRSAEAKQRLAPALSSINREKTLAAPVVAIFAYDLKFPDHLPRFYHNPDAKKWYTKTPEHTQETAFRNASLQAAYFMFAIRALGADIGAISGFDARAVEREFLAGSTLEVNFICNIGYGDPAELKPRLPRLTFDEILHRPGRPGH